MEIEATAAFDEHSFSLDASMPRGFEIAGDLLTIASTDGSAKGPRIYAEFAMLPKLPRAAVYFDGAVTIPALGASFAGTVSLGKKGFSLSATTQIFELFESTFDLSSSWDLSDFQVAGTLNVADVGPALLKLVLTKIKAAVAAATALVTAGVSEINSLKAGVQSTMNDVVGAICAADDEPCNQVLGAVTSLLQGIVDGALSAVSTLASELSNIADKLIDTALGASFSVDASALLTVTRMAFDLSVGERSVASSLDLSVATFGVTHTMQLSASIDCLSCIAEKVFHNVFSFFVNFESSVTDEIQRITGLVSTAVTNAETALTGWLSQPLIKTRNALRSSIECDTANLCDGTKTTCVSTDPEVWLKDMGLLIEEAGTTTTRHLESGAAAAAGEAAAAARTASVAERSSGQQAAMSDDNNKRGVLQQQQQQQEEEEQEERGLSALIQEGVTGVKATSGDTTGSAKQARLLKNSSIRQLNSQYKILPKMRRKK